jgi:hypothetical protein
MLAFLVFPDGRALSLSPQQARRGVDPSLVRGSILQILLPSESDLFAANTPPPAWRGLRLFLLAEISPSFSSTISSRESERLQLVESISG